MIRFNPRTEYAALRDFRLVPQLQEFRCGAFCQNRSSQIHWSLTTRVSLHGDWSKIQRKSGIQVWISRRVSSLRVGLNPTRQVQIFQTNICTGYISRRSSQQAICLRLEPNTTTRPRQSQREFGGTKLYRGLRTQVVLVNEITVGLTNPVARRRGQFASDWSLAQMMPI